MPQHYSDPSRENNPHALPNVETFTAEHDDCRDCEQTITFAPDEIVSECAECGTQSFRTRQTKTSWFYQFCFPGCLPDSDPIGPFATETLALEDARKDNES